MKKRIEKSLPPKSNLSVDEQVYFIKKTFKYLDEVNNKNLIFNKKKYIGFMNKNYGFFEESNELLTNKEKIALKFNPKGIITGENILSILDSFDNLNFNRLFTIKINKEKSEIIDNISMSNKEFNNIIYFGENFEFKINSTIMYLFRLNKKTFSKKNYLYIFDTYILIELKRKNKNMLLYISI